MKGNKTWKGPNTVFCSWVGGHRRGESRTKPQLPGGVVKGEVDALKTGNEAQKKKKGKEGSRRSLVGRRETKMIQPGGNEGLMTRGRARNKAREGCIEKRGSENNSKKRKIIRTGETGEPWGPSLPGTRQSNRARA